MTDHEIKKIEALAAEIRYETFKEIAHLGVGHLGGAMSIADVLAVLSTIMNADPEKAHDPDRDRLVVSKGHAGPSVYAMLALKGYFPMEMLETLNQPGTHLPSHCDRNLTPGIDFCTGSLGNGMSLAVGAALGSKLAKGDDYAYLILGDGECQEGQVWEGALFAAQYGLDHLIAFLDDNHMQIDGYTSDVNSIEDARAKFASFGWDAVTVNGHDVKAIVDAIDKAKVSPGKPHMIVLDTVKGKGCPYAEEAGTKCHNMPVSKETADKVLPVMYEAYRQAELAAKGEN